MLAAAACAAGVALGNWQAGRADQKRERAAQREMVALRGVFLPQHTVLLDNKIRQGRVGYEVITPLRLADDAMHVLVNRGWIEAPPRREHVPQPFTPPGEVRIEGIALERLPQALALEEDPDARVRQNLDVAAFARRTGLELQPRVIEQHSFVADGLLRDWPRPDAGVEKHEMYALQWYSLAALAVALVIALSIRREPPAQ